MAKATRTQRRRTVFTIGHSNRSIEEFVGLLQACEVDVLVDVRRKPVSRFCPQFNKARLTATLADAGIDYHHELGLGGLLEPVPEAARHTALASNASLQAFVEHLGSEPGRAALERILGLASKKTVAIVCKEKAWRACHRQFIADALVLLHQVPVNHILFLDDEGVTVFMEHQPFKGARVEGARLVFDGRTEG